MSGGVPSLLRIEIRHGLALLAAPFVLLAAWWLAWYGIYGTMTEAAFTNVYIWEETSRAVKDSILTFGPLVAGISAWTAGRNHWRGMGDLLSTTARPSTRRDFTIWVGATLPFAVAYALLAVLLGVPTALNATWGAPIPGYVLVGLVAILMDSALGFAAGYLVPSRFTAPLVAIALYVGHLLPMGASDYGSGVGLLSPAAYSNMMGADVFHEAPHIAVQQTLLFGGLTAVALSSVAFKAGARRASRIALAVSISVTVAGLAAALMSGNPYGYNTTELETVSFEYACEEGEITVCVHPAYAKLLPETAREINLVAEPLAGIPGTPTRAVQTDNYTTPEDFEEGAATFGDAGDRSRYDIASSLVADEAVMDKLWSTAGKKGFTEEDLRRCGGSPDKRYFEPAYEAQSVIGDWLLKRSGDQSYWRPTGECPNAENLVDRFANLPAAEREAWLEKNLTNLRAGKVTLKDLP